MEDLIKPKTFYLQWHITERCNWHCKHCYQGEHPAADLSLEELLKILDQYVSLIKKWKLFGRATLSLTGGEPFVREDFFQLLEKVSAQATLHGFRWALLSNGSLLDEKKIIKLKELGLHSFQVSIEGMEKTNDEIRGKGTFKKTIEAIELLKAADIQAVVSLTLTKKNMRDIPPLINLCEKLGVKSLGTRRIIPWGRGEQLKEYMLQPQELKEYYLSIKEINKKLAKRKSTLRVGLGCENSIFNEDILADPDTNMRVSTCGVIYGRCITIMANGDVMHCRRLPIVMGNALKDNLYDVWYSKPMRDLRDIDKLHPFCKKCPNFLNCFGGAKCVTYAYSGKLNIPDIQCWRAYKTLDEPLFK